MKQPLLPLATLALAAGLASAQTTYLSQPPDHTEFSANLWFSDVATYDPLWGTTQYVGDELVVAAGDRITPTKLTWWGADFKATFTGADQFTVEIREDDGFGIPGNLLWTNGGAQPTVTVTGYSPTWHAFPWNEKRYELALTGAPLLESGTYYVIVYNETTWTSDGTWGWSGTLGNHPASEPGFVFSDQAGAVWYDSNPPTNGMAWELEGDLLEPFVGTPSSISLSAGGAQTLTLDAGPAFANDLYLVLGSVSGTTPGFDLNGMSVPLNIDTYFSYTLANPNSVFLPASFGSLDALGQRSTFLSVGGGQDPALAGLTAAHAFVAFDPVTLDVGLVSNAVTVDLTP